MAKLVLLSEGLTGRTHDLKGDRTTIGRVEDNIFQIADASVSSHHCEAVLRGTDVVIKDLNSTNGTFINGERVTEATLKSGQILRLGSIEMRLESGAPAAPGKKPLDHTMVIPQGVKLGELEAGGTKAVNFGKDSPFAKKTNKGNRIFIAAAVVLGLVIVGIVVWALFLSGK